MPAFYECDSVTPKGQESLDRVEWRQQLGRPDPSVGELRAGGGGRDGFSGLLPFHRTTEQGETGSRLLFAFGSTVTHPLDKCHAVSLQPHPPAASLCEYWEIRSIHSLWRPLLGRWAEVPFPEDRVGQVQGWRWGDLDGISQQSLGQASLDLQKCRRNWKFALEKSTKILAIVGH